MTREEAIKYLQDIGMRFVPTDQYGDYDDPQPYDDAIDMAIEALENKPTPCEKCIHVKSCRKVIILKNRTYKLIKYCSQGAERREE